MKNKNVTETYIVDSMRCASCIGKIEVALSQLPGVTKVSAHLVEKSVEVTGGNRDLVIKTLTSLGYPAKLKTLSNINENMYLSISNMSCSSCVSKIETALLNIDGVKVVNVNFVEASAEVEGNFKASDILFELDKIGYPAKILKQQDQDYVLSRKTERKKETNLSFRRALFAFIVGLILLIPDLVAHVSETYQLYPSFYNQSSGMIGMDPKFFWLIAWLIVFMVLIYSGSHIYQSAYKQLRYRSFNMDSLIALGTGAAFVYSTIVILLSQWLPKEMSYIYLDAAVLILAFVNFGHALETRAKGKTSEAIEQLIGLKPKTTIVLREGKEVVLDVDLLSIGDCVLVKPGQKLPVDGIIIDGESNVNESMLTGEALPVAKNIGDQVYQGTINLNGALTVEVNVENSQTALANIISLVRQAQSSKPEIARLADKLASFFIPFVLGIAFISFGIWLNFSFVHAITVAIAILVIACPCALGLATPIATMIGMGKSAEYGVLIRNAQALQLSSQLDYVIFDKTGTITKGMPEVTEVFWNDQTQKDKVLSYLYHIENRSEHPLAQALCHYIKKQNIKLEPVDVKGFKSNTGLGIKASINSEWMYIGNEKMMLDNKIMPSHSDKEKIDSIATDGATPILVAINSQVVLVIAINDPIKSEAKGIIDELKVKGISTAMITGDNQKTAQAVAREIGIENVYAEVLPQDKSAYVRRLQNQGHTVGMVGDGINDAPALSQAHVGFAIGSGTDVALESADITLSSNQLTGIKHAIVFSQKVMRNIKQNLFGALIYNIVAIPIAAGVLYPFWGILLSPIIASLAMALSSVTVVLNASRLRKVKF